MSVTHKLARYISESKYEDIPEEVINKAKLLILDAIGCTLAGSKAPSSQIIINTIKRLGGSPQSTIIGDGTKVNCVQVSYINAHSCDALDYDDTLGFLGHPSATHILPALAVAEYLNASGKDMILAVVLAYEVAIRIAFANRPSWLAGYPPAGSKRRGVQYYWHSFGSGVAAGKLLGLEEDEVASCIGLTAAATPLRSKTSEEGGSRAYFKGYNFAEDASAGVMGALLASNGFLGCDTILDGEDGFWNICGSDRCDFERMTQKLGEEYEIMKVGFKPWPCCRSIHPTCDAVKAILKEHRVNVEKIEEIIVKTRWSAMFSQHRPINIIDAQFSIPWAVAMVIRNEQCGLPWYKKAHFKNTAILNIMDKVRVIHDPEADRLHQFPMRKWVSTVIIKTVDDNKFTKYVDSPKGDPENPLSVNEIKNKFLNQASSIGLKNDIIKEIITLVDKLDKINDVSQITMLLSP